MITLRNITLRRGPHILLQNVNWALYPAHRYGLIGANGSGKTSLFGLLLNQLHADSGDIDYSRNLRIAHVSQETPGYSQPAIDFVLDGDVALRELEKQLLVAEQEDDGLAIAKLHHELSHIDAYTANSRAAQLLAGLGFSDPEQSQPVNSFSGGWRMRLNLAQALMCPSDVLLLDEPTNHLDLDAIIWLEGWLKRYQGTLLLISHDRDFLDKVVDYIAHIDHQELKQYTGNYSSFEKQRAAFILLQQAAFEKQQKHIAHMQSFVNRFKAKASKAKQAQSRMKAIERLELVSAVQMDSPFHFEFKESKPCANPLVSLQDTGVAYGEKVVLTDINLNIGPKDRIGILGPNGAGKSSLIKLLAGIIPARDGIRVLSSGVKIGYFAQHQIDYLQLDESPLFHLKQLPGSETEQQLRGYLGGFDFVGDRVHDKVKIFSGGEKSRLALALLIYQRPNLILLDEPTNHLDLEMRQALTLALQDYDGAMLLVSHDRFLLRSACDVFQLVAHGKLSDFAGDLDDYEKWLLDYRKTSSAPTAPIQNKTEVNKKQQRQDNAKARELLKPLSQKIKTLEAKIEKLQQSLGETTNQLADQSIYDDKDKLQNCLARQNQLQQELQVHEAQWVELCEQKDALS